MLRLRRRYNLRFIFTIGLILLFVFFFMIIFQSTEIENSDKIHRKSRYKDKVRQINDDDVDQSKRFKNINRFNFKNKNYDDQEFDQPSRSELSRTMKSMQKLIHLDLKGSPPKLSYLKDLIPFLKKSGATGVIIEYEDFFPFKEDLESITNQNHYTNQELKQIFDLLKQNQMTIIPLIQTYGHLEFVLKLKEFSYLREAPEHYQVISPCLNDSYTKVLFKMIDQILEIHPEEMEYIHIGCDEVYHINKNPACSNLNGLKTTQDFFIYHVTNLVNYIKSKRPNLNVMIWEDMIRRNMLEQTDVTLKKFTKKIVPVVWNYKKEVEISENVFKIYDDLFSELWFASAFKGATRQLELVPNADLHYSNHLSWINIIRNFPSTHKIKGMVLTGWSRYDHMQAVCEIIPAAIPSMVLCLQALANYQEDESIIFQETKKITKCNYPYHESGFIFDVTSLKNITNKPFSVESVINLYNCDFPGSNLYNWLLGLKITSFAFETKHEKFSDVLNKYNLKHNFFNTMTLSEAKDVFYPSFKNRFKMFLSIGEKEFDKLFYADLYEELSSVYIQRYIDLIDERIIELNKTKIPESAPVRPFNKINKLDVGQSIL